MAPKSKAAAGPGRVKVGAAKALAVKAAPKAKAPAASKAVAKAKTAGKAAGALRHEDLELELLAKELLWTLQLMGSLMVRWRQPLPR